MIFLKSGRIVSSLFFYMSKLCTPTHFKPQGPELLKTDPHSMARLEKEWWLPLFQKFSSHNSKVMKSFALNLNGDKDQIRDVHLRLTEGLVTWACKIPQQGERWLKNQCFNKGLCVSFLQKEHSKPDLSKGISQDFLKIY